jgi:hypothetical protein
MHNEKNETVTQSTSRGFKGGKALGEKKQDKQQFHKTKLLLSIYRTVVWRIESSILQLDDTALEYGGKRISELIDFLSFELDDYDCVKDRQAIEERLTSVAETKQMIEIIDKALNHLKTHPKQGQIYHDIITFSYIDKEAMSDEIIMRKLNLTQSTYYRYKKKAMELMGIALWGYIIPPLRDYWNNLQ